MIALLDSSEFHHEWAVELIQTLEPPIFACEPVLAEAERLLRRRRLPSAGLFAMVGSGALDVGFRISNHVAPISILMKRYSNIPMSLADACLVRMAELTQDSAIWTLDRDFNVYRRHGRSVLPLMMPE
ncbi:MAG: PIN domain-containing protein [Planctomycetes bacterium]|nr:PIN domain-containing protein [Planctomycetota bacterium]